MPPGIDPQPYISIENVTPELNCGRYAVKREVGDTLAVEADIFKDGHDVIAAAVRYRPEGRGLRWRESRMTHVDNDRWRGVTGPMDRTGRWLYTVVAWTDRLAGQLRDIRRKLDAGQEVPVEREEIAILAREAAGKARGRSRARLRAYADRLSDDGDIDAAFEDAFRTLMGRHLPRACFTRYEHRLPLQVDRERARFAAWYEMFPRSASNDPARHGTFSDVIDRLPHVRELGFDVLYFPPIHPIGRTNRKGKDNALEAGADDPGSPYAIGGEEGGHTAVHPELGTLEDFRKLVKAAKKQGLEIALDFAIQVSPDHPYVREHPEWFFHRPDGSIKYAENPPKRYEDIYPLDFHGERWQAQWREWREVLLFWVKQGVKIFRVDNPHTKPLRFWEWTIREVQRDHPDVIFLAEAFTRPKMMRALAKAGFSQSYTYFTWRNEKAELTEYFTELTQGPMRDYFRGNLFPNTPDILHEFLQDAPPAAFRIRAMLAATLSSVWGMYSGFELCENAPHPEREEYRDNEKYEIKRRDWDAPGNIKELIEGLNRIRREQPALQEYDNLRFHPCDNDRVLFYGKWAPDGSHVIFIVVSLDPSAVQETTLDVPTGDLGLSDDDVYEAHELLSGERLRWQRAFQRLRLEPEAPGRLFRVEVRS